MTRLFFLIFATVVKAMSYGNQSTLDIAAQSAKAIYDSSLEGVFIDCVSVTSSLLASRTALQVITTDTFTSLPSIDTATSSSEISFEEYWCDNFNRMTTSGYSYGPFIGYLNASDQQYCMSLEKSSYYSWIAANHTTIQWQPTLTSPCCNALCNIAASAVQLHFWPTPAPYSNVTTVIGSDGFTYTSPSVYVAYQNLFATGQCGILGSSYASVTLSYDPSAISSYSGGFFGGDATAINYADLATNCTTRALDQSDAPYPNSYDQAHCSPLLSMPAGLQDLNPAWSTCVDSLEFDHPGYVIDPPRAIIAAPALVPAPTKDPSPGTTAAPGSVASPSTPQKTSPPSEPKTGSGSGNDPSAGNLPITGNDPSGAQNPPPGNNPPSGNNLPSGDQLPPDNDPSSANDPPLEKAPSTDKDAPTGKDLPVGNGLSSGNDPPTGKDPSDGGNAPAGNTPSANIPSFQNDPLAENDPAAGVGSSTGSDPLTGNFLSDPDGADSGSSEASQNAKSQPGQSPDSEPSTDELSAVASLPFITTVAGHVIQAIPSSPQAVLVDGQSIARGDGSTLVSGTLVALHSNGDLVLGTSTVQHLLSNLRPTSEPVFTVGTQPFTLISNNLVASGQTIKANDPGVNFDGTIVSLGQSELQIGTSTINLISNYPTLISPVITAAGRLANLLSNGVAMDGAILTTNAPAITVEGTPISLGPNGLVVGSSTVLLPSPPPGSMIDIAGRPYVISQAADGLVTLLPNGVAVAGATLTRNAPAITVAGTRISLGDYGLVVGSSTVSLPSPPSTSSIVIAGQTYAVSRIADGVTVAGTTLRIGQPAITVSGTAMALESAGLVIDGTSTIPYQSIIGSPPVSDGVGGFVFAGLNGGPTAKLSTASATGPNQRKTNDTGAAGGLDTFRGMGAKVDVRLDTIAEIAVAMVLTWYLF